MAATDEQLALQLQRGDQSAVDPLVERHYDPLLGYLYRMLDGDRPLAEDLVQETFLRVLRGISGFDSSRRFKPWLYAIATNLARSHYTRAETRRTITDDAPEHADVLDPPEAALLADDEARAVSAALRTLPDHQRETLVLYYYGGLSLQAVADTLGIPLGTVKSRLSNGVRRLRQHITELDREADHEHYS
ncbi:MAG: RNA polymerase sigma factor [Chloroflexi bacterium]|nr:RNA polymerase sigma factor [Chloroflexota bacterium]